MGEQQNDLQALIERYNREMMEQYASVIPDPERIPSKPSSSELPLQSTALLEETQEIPMEIEEQTEPDENNNNELIDVGRLQVRVSTENEAIPIPGAVITITKQDGGQTQLIRTVIADDSGLTRFLELPTKDRRLSLEPNHPDPYATYTLDVTADGYFPKRFTDLPIYGGVTAIQNVSMIPLPEGGDRDAVLTYPQSGPAL